MSADAREKEVVFWTPEEFFKDFRPTQAHLEGAV